MTFDEQLLILILKLSGKVVILSEGQISREIVDRHAVLILFYFLWTKALTVCSNNCKAKDCSEGKLQWSWEKRTSPLWLTRKWVAKLVT